MVCSYKLRFKVENDPISGCWDILLLLFWGRLPLGVVFISRVCKLWFCHLSLSLTIGYDPISACRDIPLLIFWGRLSLRLPLILRICKIWFGHLGWSLKFEYDPIGESPTIFDWKSSSWYRTETLLSVVQSSAVFLSHPLLPVLWVEEETQHQHFLC